MIDVLDKQAETLPIEQPPRGRGRPKTGQAMTPAEKQRAYRQRVAEQMNKGNVAEIIGDANKEMDLLKETLSRREQLLNEKVLEVGKLKETIAELKGALEKAEKEAIGVTQWRTEIKLNGDRAWTNLGGGLNREEAISRVKSYAERGLPGDKYRAVPDYEHFEIKIAQKK